MLRRAPLAAALAALALAAALAAPPAAAQDSTDAEAASTAAAVTTTLQPGWNMAAWLGEDAPVSAIFEAVPELDLVSAWDAEAQIERRARPRSVLRDGLTRLTAGMGLWLRVGGDEAVEWTQEAAAGSVLLELREGRNVVGWTGRDGVTAAEALARFGDRLADASRWDAETGGFERYRPGAPEDANTLRALRRGDAIEVEMASDARWWQSGGSPPLIEFIGDMGEEERARIAGWVDRARAVYAERWGIEAPFTLYAGPSREALASDYLQLRGKHVDDLFCADYSDSVVFAMTNCLSERVMRHEYFHVIQDSLSERSISLFQWLTEGTAEYAELIDRAELPDLALRLDRERDRVAAVLGRRIAPPLESLESNEVFKANRDTGYGLGFVAVEWLVDRSSEAAILDFYRSLTASADWREEFEAAFGVSPDAFYAEFEAYRADLAPSLPHLTDDRDGPVLVFVGDVPSEAQTAVRAELARVQAFFAERFGTPTPEFTVFAGLGTTSLAAAHLRAFGREIDAGFCDRAQDAVTVVALTCGASPHFLDWHYHFHVRSRLAPWGSLSEAAEGHNRRGPLWLLRGVGEYAKATYRAAAGVETYEDARSRHISRASRTGQTLSSVATRSGADTTGQSETNALGFLAAERLVALAGEPALFAYYEALPDAADWREAFEAAFGIAPEAFYADFDAYSAEAAPPLPHLADDREEPVLAFAGDVPAGTQAAVRAEFDSLRAFYAARFGLGGLDFTIWAAADAESAAAVHILVFGSEIPDGFCTGGLGAAAIIVLDCEEHRGWRHEMNSRYLHRVLTQLAPWGSLPEAAEGYDRRGPRWLLLAAERYAGTVYGAAAGREQLDRNRRIAFARRSAQPLEDMETDAGADAVWPPAASALSFLAAERLVALAGEPALFAYYEALPDAAGWREAFETAFGVAPAAFYADFEAYRARVAPPFVQHDLRGVVLDPGGRPLAGVWIAAGRGEPDWEHTATTGEDGTFALRVRDGRYGLTLDAAASRCRPDGGNVLWDIARVGVAGAGVEGIVIRLPRGASCDPP